MGAKIQPPGCQKSSRTVVPEKRGRGGGAEKIIINAQCSMLNAQLGNRKAGKQGSREVACDFLDTFAVTCQAHWHLIPLGIRNCAGTSQNTWLLGLAKKL
jgi:hypothetical protein